MRKYRYNTVQMHCIRKSRGRGWVGVGGGGWGGGDDNSRAIAPEK